MLHHAENLALLLKRVAGRETRRIRNTSRRGQLTGAQRFVEEIAARDGRRIAVRGQGRPRRTENKSVPF